MNRISTKVKMLVVLCAAFMLCSTVAYAREIANYNMIIPRFGGVTYTDTLLKDNQSRAVNNNTSVGGGYTMNCAIYRGNDKLTGTFSANSGDRILLKYNNPANDVGTRVKMGAWTSLFTTVKVQATGSWSPDEN